MNQKMLEGEFTEDERASAFNKLKTLTLIPFTNKDLLTSEILSTVSAVVSQGGETTVSQKSGFIVIEFPAVESLRTGMSKKATRRNYPFNLLLTKSVHFVERSFPFRVLFQKEHS